MCDCANCDGITLFEGTDGNGIASTSFNSTTGILTFYYTDGTTFNTTSLIGYAPPSLYVTNALGSGTSGISPAFSVLPSMTYTIPTGGTGIYEILFVANSEFTFASTSNFTVTVNIYKNGAAIAATNAKSAKMSGVSSQNFSIPITVLASNISAIVGDTITIQSSSTAPSSAYLTAGVLKINKIG
jgi:hypothetical protein